MITEKDSRYIQQYVAERSPGSYAQLIFKRFSWALALLNEWEVRWLDDSAESMILSAVSQSSCPHCNFDRGRYRCAGCLYTQAYKRLGYDSIIGTHLTCISVLFGGVSGDQVHVSDVANVSLSAVSIELHVNLPGTSLLRYGSISTLRKRVATAQQQLDRCKAFCQGHMNWTNFYKWGSRLKKGKP